MKFFDAFLERSHELWGGGVGVGLQEAAKLNPIRDLTRVARDLMRTFAQTAVGVAWH
jgi:hypothetical protein